MTELLASDTGQSVERIRQDINRDFWMSAPEALQYGIIDSIVGATEATIAADRAEQAADASVQARPPRPGSTNGTNGTAH
jgi:hypothetical protein